MPGVLRSSPPRIRRGIVFGLAAGAIHCVVAFMIYAARGYDTGMEIFFPQLVLGYLIGGSAGGAIWGLVEPWTRNLVGAYMIGVTASLPFFITLAGLMMPAATWWPQRTLVACIAAAVVGGGAGLIISDVLKS